ncbi:glycosyltransferase family 2 protein [Fibrella sp. WM1]|uniref:glycosyltransferase family 2 protein n=1 Tax=Fibrella musci TaxID=3242485 RepID=UPI00352085B5
MIYIIIPVYNRRDYTRGCLSCLRKQTYTAYQAVVVDDGSTDGTADMIATEFPEVTVLNGDGNLWWTKAVNMGVDYALKHSKDVNSDLLLTLNDDLTFDPDYLSTMMDSYNANKPCLIGSVVVDINNPNYLEYAGGKCNYYTAKGNRTSALYNNDYSKLANSHFIVSTDELSGRGTLMPLEIFGKIGAYDAANFPHYMADIEFSVRARKKGYKLFVSVASKIYNYMEATRNKQKSSKEFFAGFWSFKSPNYLRARYTFAVRHTPLKIVYFAVDLGRTIASFAIKNK